MEKPEMKLSEWVMLVPNALRADVRKLLADRVNTLRTELAELVEAITAMDGKDSKYTQALQDEPPAIECTVTYCLSCKAGGDSSNKVCIFRSDTGITEGWWCDDCYKNWRNTP